MSNYVKLTLAYILGIILVNSVEVSYLVVVGIIILVLLIILRNHIRESVYINNIIVIMFIIGSIFGYINLDGVFNENVPFNENYVTIHGRISELPIDNGDETYTYILKTRELEYNGENYKNNELIKISSREEYNYGECVAFEGFLKEFSEKANSVSFDTKMFYKSKNIYHHMTARKSFVEPVQYTVISLKNAANIIRYKTANVIDDLYTGRSNAFLKAILVGDKHYFDDDTQNILYSTGAMRFLYTPFLHIMMISFLVSAIFGLLPKRYRNYILMIVLLVYASCNSTRPIFIKSCVFIFAMLYHKRRFGYVYYPDILSATVLGVLMFEPLLIFNVGFTMSLVCNIGFYFLRPTLDKHMQFVKNLKIRTIIILWITSTISTLPICAIYFGTISVYTMVLSFLYVPVVLAVIVLAPILFIGISLFGSFPIIEEVMQFTLYLLVNIPIVINKIPFSHLDISVMSINEVICYYLVLITIKLILDKKMNEFSHQLIGVSSSVMICMVISSNVLSAGNMYINFVNVGQGDGAVISIPFQSTAIIDGGGGSVYSDYNIGKHIFVPYLKSKGHTNIDTAFVSHYHKDHVEGVIEAVKGLKVNTLVLPECSPENEYRITLEQEALKSNTTVLYINEDCEFIYKSGMRIKVYSPYSHNIYIDDENDTSLVLEVVYGNVNALFTGDMTVNCENRYVEDNAFGECEIVKVPHHGSKTSNSEKFIEHIKAKYAIISVDGKSTYGLPNTEVVKRYNQYGVDVLRTDENGDIEICTNKKGIKSVKSYRSVS